MYVHISKSSAIIILVFSLIFCCTFQSLGMLNKVFIKNRHYKINELVPNQPRYYNIIVAIKMAINCIGIWLVFYFILFQTCGRERLATLSCFSF